jgi:hypothetical protein
MVDAPDLQPVFCFFALICPMAPMANFLAPGENVARSVENG